MVWLSSSVIVPIIEAYERFGLLVILSTSTVLIADLPRGDAQTPTHITADALLADSGLAARRWPAGSFDIVRWATRVGGLWLCEQRAANNRCFPTAPSLRWQAPFPYMRRDIPAGHPRGSEFADQGQRRLLIGVTDEPSVLNCPAKGRVVPSLALTLQFGQRISGSLCNERTFQLSEDSRDARHCATVRRGQINLVDDGNQADLASPEAFEQCETFRCVSAEAIEPHYRNARAIPPGGLC
jgi:hypothetical protein